MSNLEDLPTWAVCGIAAIVAGIGRQLLDAGKPDWRTVFGRLLCSLAAGTVSIGSVEWLDAKSPASLYFAACSIAGFMGPDLMQLLRAFVRRRLRKLDE